MTVKSQKMTAEKTEVMVRRKKAEVATMRKKAVMMRKRKRRKKRRMSLKTLKRSLKLVSAYRKHRGIPRLMFTWRTTCAAVPQGAHVYASRLTLRYTDCMRTTQCAPLKREYDECSERVKQQQEEGEAKEDCVEECEYFMRYPRFILDSFTFRILILQC